MRWERFLDGRLMTEIAESSGKFWGRQAAVESSVQEEEDGSFTKQDQPVFKSETAVFLFL